MAIHKTPTANITLLLRPTPKVRELKLLDLHTFELEQHIIETLLLVEGWEHHQLALKMPDVRLQHRQSDTRST